MYDAAQIMFLWEGTITVWADGGEIRRGYFATGPSRKFKPTTFLAQLWLAMARVEMSFLRRWICGKD